MLRTISSMFLHTLICSQIDKIYNNVIYATVWKDYWSDKHLRKSLSVKRQLLNYCNKQVSQGSTLNTEKYDDLKLQHTE